MFHSVFKQKTTGFINFKLIHNYGWTNYMIQFDKKQYHCF